MSTAIKSEYGVPASAGQRPSPPRSGRGIKGEVSIFPLPIPRLHSALTILNSGVSSYSRSSAIASQPHHSLPLTTPFRNAANTRDSEAVPLPAGQRSPFIRTKNCRGQGARSSKTFNDLFRR